MTHKYPWPTKAQAALLGVCLHRDYARTLRCWERWKALVDLDDLDHPSFWIMSLLYSRLVELDIADPELPRIKGLRRYQWTRDQLTMRGLRELLAHLHAARIPAMLLLGAALRRTAYADPGTRCLHDAEVAVPAEAAEAALTRLAAAGWTMQGIDPALRVRHVTADALVHPELGTMILRWGLLHDQPGQIDERPLWDAAGKVDFEGTKARILAPAHQFLHLCRHGIRNASTWGPQWLVDCASLILHSPQPMNWDRLFDAAREFQLSPYVLGTLRYLRGHFGGLIPREVVSAMAGIPVPFEKRVEYLIAKRPPAQRRGMAPKIGLIACRYMRLPWTARPLTFARDSVRLAHAVRARGRLRNRFRSP